VGVEKTALIVAPANERIGRAACTCNARAVRRLPGAHGAPYGRWLGSDRNDDRVTPQEFTCRRYRLVDSLDVQRLATALAMPLSLGLVLGAAGLALVWRVRWWFGVLAMGCDFGLIGVCSLSAVGESLMARLEAGYPPRMSADCESADAIVVLGGAIQPQGDQYPRLHRGSDRLLEVVRLYRAGCAPVVAVSSSALVLAAYRGSETAAMADRLADLGVPRSAMLLVAQGRNTLGNATFSRALLQSFGIHGVGTGSVWFLTNLMFFFVFS